MASDAISPFERLDAWQGSRTFVCEVYGVTDVFPKNEIYGITGQLRRAAVSVSVNIAEGAAKKGHENSVVTLISLWDL